MQKKWWHKSVVYQIYPKSFSDTNNDGIGDINGIIGKLSYLENLGVDVIWLSPVYKSPMKDNGYDISDYTEIDPIFGTLEDMDLLISKAKAKDIKILMDLVINHTSDQHDWFIESRKSKDNPYRDYYIWRDEPNDLVSVFGGSAWSFDEKTKQYYFHNFSKEQPDLNWENPVVFDEISNIINWWLKRGIGGFRMDVIDLIGKKVDQKILSNGPKLHQLIKKLNKSSFGNFDILTVGETWGATPEIAELYSNPLREELSMIFQFEHMQLDWGKYGKWDYKKFELNKLKQIFIKWQTELKCGWNSLFWNNHDLPRIVSRWGNDREYRVESAKMFAIILHLLKGTPYIYQGEEIGMTNVRFDSLDDYNDVEIHGAYQDIVVINKHMSKQAFMEGVYKMGRDNARTPMQWNSSKYAGFSKTSPWLKVNPNYLNINVQEEIKSKDSIFDIYKQVINMRKKSIYSETIIYGDFEVLFEDNPNIFAYRRFDEQNSITVIANFTDKIIDFPIKISNPQILISNYEKSNYKILRPYEVITFIIG